jgi:hypothetical protein
MEEGRRRHAIRTWKWERCLIIPVYHDRNQVEMFRRRTMRRLAAALEVEPADVAEFRRALSGEAPADD